MCHRKLWFDKYTQCGHLVFTSSQDIDCGQTFCFNSTAHPATCVAPNCQCRRFFTQPERLISREVTTISSDLPFHTKLNFSSFLQSVAAVHTPSNPPVLGM
ncbi:hypothetical protein BJ322DRAFT_1029048 [Thelephora terrestris]|uniref:Uncharacterized protein n=1 Tax=Thelephora terrestris TaxID=56493 RepID=A0A9P6LBH6_9AGAM|nr:hypothetical protein BJ322DRAFT_1029048 [Thelephora terrestris]